MHVTCVNYLWINIAIDRNWKGSILWKWIAYYYYPFISSNSRWQEFCLMCATSKGDIRSQIAIASNWSRCIQRMCSLSCATEERLFNCLMSRIWSKEDRFLITAWSGESFAYSKLTDFENLETKWWQISCIVGLVRLISQLNLKDFWRSETASSIRKKHSKSRYLLGDSGLTNFEPVTIHRFWKLSSERETRCIQSHSFQKDLFEASMLPQFQVSSPESRAINQSKLKLTLKLKLAGFCWPNNGPTLSRWHIDFRPVGCRNDCHSGNSSGMSKILCRFAGTFN